MNPALSPTELPRLSILERKLTKLKSIFTRIIGSCTLYSWEKWTPVRQLADMNPARSPTELPHLLFWVRKLTKWESIFKKLQRTCRDSAPTTLLKCGWLNPISGKRHPASKMTLSHFRMQLSVIQMQTPVVQMQTGVYTLQLTGITMWKRLSVIFKPDKIVKWVVVKGKIAYKGLQPLWTRAKQAWCDCYFPVLGCN
jgi:hypothetical protein